MNTSMPVKTIMTPQPFTVEFSKDIFSVQAFFRKHRFRHLPVVHHGELVGILSKVDIDHLSFSYALADDEYFDDAVDSLKVSQLMCPHPRTVRENDSIYKAASILAKAESHALPVLSDDGKKLTGIVAVSDIIQYLLTGLDQ